ncbi:hypothetical protein DPMN_000699 [Dreissena polymorpha]|uniref:Uncharacterized protein n=1 Tax=Dreissena polymorpha TaxID=45954 RepID=A0A9D4MHW1_DREPO|nr:hypothetical protein DPMN_000699 [Dreissena polymorpha]
MERRQSYLWMECMEMIGSKLDGKDFKCFHFGCKTEGTTIPRLQSDFDMLTSHNKVNVMRVLGDWLTVLINVLMLRDDITTPQQYLLQVFRTDTPEPVTNLFVRKDSGGILVSAERWKQRLEHIMQDQGEATKNGPSVSDIAKWDLVQAFHVQKPLPEIQH